MEGNWKGSEKRHPIKRRQAEICRKFNRKQKDGPKWVIGRKGMQKKRRQGKRRKRCVGVE